MLRLPVLFVVAALVGPLAACTSTPKVADLEPEQTVVTASVAKTAYASGLNMQDADLLKNEVVTADALPRAWTNPETGTNGSIASLDAYTGRHGQKCRSFRTTIATFFGVSWFNGEACEVETGRWALSWLKRVD